MKTKKSTLLILIISGVIVLLISLIQVVKYRAQENQSDQNAERIILAYIDTNGLNISPGTKDYQKFMKGILLGEYPDLTGKDSIYATTDEELKNIIAYAVKHMNLPRNIIYKEPTIPEAKITP
jgi:hypothetical protein